MTPTFECAKWPGGIGHKTSFRTTVLLSQVPRLLVGLAVAIPTFCKVAPAATTVQTGDGFSIDLTDDGRVSRVSIGTFALPLTKHGGFAIADFHTMPEERNLIDDGGFEQIERRLDLDKYQQIDTNIRHSGVNSLRIAISPDNPASSSFTASARVRPGRRYRVGMWVRRSRVGACGAFAVEKDSQGKPCGLVLQTQQVIPSKDDEWVPVSWEITTARDTESVEVRVTLWKSHGKLWADDFFIYEVDEGNYVPLSGTISSDDKGHTFHATQTKSGLELTATYRPLPSCIRIDGEIVDKTGRDRAIGVRFSLPWDAIGWTWHHDTEEQEPVGSVPVLRRTYRCRSGVGECSVYPWASLTSSDGGLSLAVPMNDGPRVFLTQHDTAAKETSLSFFFGLVADTQRAPSRARFSLLLYRHDPAWGMRSTIDRYMKLFPQVFEKRMPHEAYLNYANLERFDPQTHELIVNNKHRVPDASDFGEGYVVVDSIHGCYDFMQTAFDDPTARPADADVLAMLNRMADDSAAPARAYLPFNDLLAKLVTGPDGELCYIGDTNFFQANEGYNRTSQPGWGLNFRVNEDPEVSQVLAARSWDAAARHTKSPGRRPWDGAFTADSIEGYLSNSQCLDYRRSHFSTASFPLTFGKETLAPALSNTIYDFLAKAWWPLSEKGKIVVYGNSNSYEQAFTAALVDLPMLESNWDIDHPGRLDRFLRAIYGKKVCRFWRAWDEQGHYGEHHRTNVLRHFDRGLAYAFFPAVYPVMLRGSGVERYRHAYRGYVAAIEQLSAAGWEPLVHGRATGGVVVERFGTAFYDSLHFTLRNDTAEEVETDLRIDCDALGLPDPDRLVAFDLLVGPVSPLAWRDGRLQLRLAAHGSRAVWVGTRPQAARRGFRIASALLEKFSRLFATDMSTVARESWDRVRKVTQEGETSSSTGSMVLALAADRAIRRLAEATNTAAPIDRDKLLARVRTAISWGPLALSGIRIETPELDQAALPGVVSQLRFAVLARDDAWAITSTTITSIVPDVRISTKTLTQKSGTVINASVAVPPKPARELLPLLVEIRGESNGQAFSVTVPYDLMVEPGPAGP